MPKISDIRKQAWETRRKKYGALGHNGAYTRNPGPCTDCERMRALIVRLHVEGVLSEGQAAKATGMYRVDLREAADNYTNSLPIERPRPMTGSTILSQIERGLDGVTEGPWEGRYVPGGMPTNCVDYGVVSLSAGIETCRVWKLEDVAHFARCSPDSIREIAAYVRDLEDRLAKAAEALEAAADQLARAHDDAFKQCAGYGLVTSDGRDFSCLQLNKCGEQASRARTALSTMEKEHD